MSVVEAGVRRQSRTTDPAVAGEEATKPVDQVHLDAARLEVATVRSHTSRVSQLVTLVAVIAPPVGVLSAAGALWGVAIRPLDCIVFGLLYLATGLGITVGYHRLFTHRSFTATRFVQITLAILGAMTLQGPLTQWVSDHRKHHARSDVDGDPHSPNLDGPGIVAATKGLWHAHMGWLFTTKGMERGPVYARDLYEDRTIRFIDRCYLLWVIVSVGLPFLIGYLVTGSTARGIETMVWAGLVRIFAFQHATFAVNSVCHAFGRRSYEVDDKSRNNWVVALLTFGEGWHNNHHAFPKSARHGLKRGQVDVSWLVIRALVRSRLAHRPFLPKSFQLAKYSMKAATNIA